MLSVACDAPVLPYCQAVNRRGDKPLESSGGFLFPQLLLGYPLVFFIAACQHVAMVYCFWLYLKIENCELAIGA
jgi:hypothetical protein